jgi:hypothetical protein
MQIIKVTASNKKGELIELSYSAETFTIDQAEASVRKHGFTVLYSSIHS